MRARLRKLAACRASYDRSSARQIERPPIVSRREQRLDARGTDPRVSNIQLIYGGCRKDLCTLIANHREIQVKRAKRRRVSQHCHRVIADASFPDV
jgi:hypothetical protein